MSPGPTLDLVVRLREIRKERGLSIAEILALLEQHSTPLSESTVRRVLDHDIDTISGFSYEATLMPLCDILLPSGDPEDSSLSEARIDGLLAVIEIKNETISDLKAQLQALKDSYEKERQDCCAQQAERCRKCEDNLAFLKKQIELKDDRMDKKDEWIDRLLGHIEEMLHAPA